MPILQACTRQPNFSSMFMVLENLCFLPCRRYFCSVTFYLTITFWKIVWFIRCEWKEAKQLWVDQVEGGFGFGKSEFFFFFFLPCDISDVLLLDQPCYWHSDFWHWGRGSIALGMISVHERKGMCFCNYKIISSLQYGFAVPWLCSSSPYQFIPCAMH